MAEDFGIFIGEPYVEPGPPPGMPTGASMAEALAYLKSDEDDEEEVDPPGLDLGNVDEMPVLDEAGLRAGLARLGVDLPAGQDAAWWEHGTVGYDLSLDRGEDGRLRMMDGTMRYLVLGGTKSADVRAVFTGLLELAESLGRGSGRPEAWSGPSRWTATSCSGGCGRWATTCPED